MNTTSSGTACVVLAAGYGKRFGADKRQARIAGDTTLLDLTLASVPPLFSPCVLVLHPGDEALAARYSQRWQAVFAPDAELGMGHSLAAALPLAADRQGVVIVLGDMPLVLPATYKAIADKLGRELIVVPCHKQQRGNPVGIGAEFFPELARLKGDQGARQLLQLHAQAVVRLDVEDPGILQDFDTAEALAQLGVSRQD